MAHKSVCIGKEDEHYYGYMCLAYPHHLKKVLPIAFIVSQLLTFSTHDGNNEAAGMHANSGIGSSHA